jgi:hypothetical protein
MEENEPSINDLLLAAGEARKNGDNSTAISLYNQLLKRDPLQIAAYNGLMKIYRKEKAFKKELETINSGIKVYEKFYNEQSGKPSKKVKEISDKLNKSFGLIDKKGTKLYYPEPIGKWQSRKEVVSKKLDKKAK